MGKLLTLLFLLLGIINAYSQNEANYDSIYVDVSPKEKANPTIVAKDSINKVSDNHAIYIEVSKNLNIKDKIFIVNHSQTTILQAAVVLMHKDSYTTIGNASMVSPGCRFEMASYSGNWLKKLKGQTLGIKIKGVKKVISGTSTSGESDGPNNIDTNLINYDYTIRLEEKDHDLYIIVTGGSGAFDF